MPEPDDLPRGSEDVLRRRTDDDRITGLEHAIRGNGGPGVSARLAELERILRGDGMGTSGVVNRLARVERLMFEDPTTGEKGLVYDVRSLADSVKSFQTTLRTLNWLLVVFGTGGAGAFVWTIVVQ